MTDDWLPVARPRLVSVERVLPYWREIDAARIYSNFGPLVRRFESKLCDHFGLSEETVVSVSNATVGLTAALMEVALPGRSLCVMPSWTFCASVHAVIAAGLQPFFIDIDARTWQITREAVADILPRLSNEVAAVMPVAGFGAPVDGSAWDAFTEATGVPVVIDAAAAFDSLEPSASPSVVSLHATKALGVGEGGFVATTDAACAARIRTRINFGFPGTRHATLAGLNGKMSEYVAAIGLAALEVWPETRQQWALLRDSYRHTFASLEPDWCSAAPPQDWVTATFVIAIGSEARAARAALARQGIDSRSWWEQGCHREPAFAACRSGPLDKTEFLAEHSIGLPFFPDMMPDSVARVAEALAPHLKDCTPGEFSIYPIGDKSSRKRQ